jgi:hypothetical protein
LTQGFAALVAKGFKEMALSAGGYGPHPLGGARWGIDLWESRGLAVVEFTQRRAVALSPYERRLAAHPTLPHHRERSLWGARAYLLYAGRGCPA